MLKSSQMIFHRDINGLIVTPDGDGGDSAANEGRYYTIKYKLGFRSYSTFKEINDLVAILQPKPGVFVRNPVHYNDPKDFSRDQTRPLIVAMGFYKLQGTIKSLFWSQVKNFFRYQNNDVGTPEDLNLYIRALDLWYLYPVLFIGDSFQLFNTIWHVGWTTREPNSFFKYLSAKFHSLWFLRFNAPPNDLDVMQDPRGATSTSNDLNITISQIQAIETYPTPISYLSRLIYKHFRPNGVQFAWDSYYKDSNDFSELIKPVTKELF